VGVARTHFELAMAPRLTGKNDRFFENVVKLTRGMRAVDVANDFGDKNRCAYLEKPSGDRIRIRS